MRVCIRPLALFAALAAALLSGCHSSSDSAAQLNQSDLQRLPQTVRDSNMPDAAKKGLAEELKNRGLNAEGKPISR